MGDNVLEYNGIEDNVMEEWLVYLPFVLHGNCSTVRCGQNNGTESSMLRDDGHVASHSLNCLGADDHDFNDNEDDDDGDDDDDDDGNKTTPVSSRPFCSRFLLCP